ncbi:MAG: SulP family inorganic anion transporter [Sphingomonadales bacterium]|nr:SulP family inorganic anion transporter [Sphingomonadales bacterium]
MNSNPKAQIPSDGIAGLKQYYKEDGLRGFLVFLLALPLSLGIAGASDFPLIMGLITAMIGGLVVCLLSGSSLTVKGAAAGLIVIVAGAVAEFGGSKPELGWKMALEAILVAGVLQIFFGFLRHSGNRMLSLKKP